MKETRPVLNKRRIAISLVFILGFLAAAYLFLKTGADPPSETRPFVFLKKNETGREKDSMTLLEQTNSAADKNESVSDKAEPSADSPGTENKKPPVDGQKGLMPPEKELPDRDGSRMAQDLPAQSGAGGSKVVQKPIQKRPAINYQDLKTGGHLDQVMKKRLQASGIYESLDMIVRSDESFTVGGKTVSMTDILEKAYAGKQKIFQKHITEFEQTVPETLNEYGIYVVQPGDNIWNIHFNILRESYASRGIQVALDADEPLDTGHSSGVGKVLKFSEIMVIIYSLIEEKVVMDIDLIEPLSKIVIYNMGDVFSLLSDICFDQIDQIQFDGRTIWIPARET